MASFVFTSTLMQQRQMQDFTHRNLCDGTPDRSYDCDQVDPSRAPA
ncbi:MAG: hypothetical protein ACR2HX_23005 [Pyrinomonadaceae bacterium]